MPVTMGTQAERRRRLAKLIKSKREDLELNQREMATVLGFRQATISLWESEKADPDVDSLEKIATYFGFTMPDFWDYLHGKDNISQNRDLRQFLTAMDKMSINDVVTIVSAGAQKLEKLAKVS